MKQSFHLELESVTVTAKIPVTLKGVKLDAECEYSAEEMQAEGSIFCQVIDQLSQKLSWLKPFIEKEIDISIRNKEMLSRDLEKQIQDGIIRAYGPNGWSILHQQQNTCKHKRDKKH